MFTLPIAHFFHLAKILLVVSVFAALTACGGGGAKAPDGSGGGGVGGGGTTAKAATLSISLVDPVTGTTKTSISSSSPGLVKVSAKTKEGNVASNVVVTFTTNASLATLSPSSGTALTDSNGEASISISAADVSAAGAATVNAKAQIGDTATVASTAFALGATQVALTDFLIDTNPLSAYGTTAIRVTVRAGGQPVSTPLTVTFSSGCGAVGKAKIDSNVATVAGVATASYQDLGCAAQDTVTASVAGITSTASGTITVNAPNTGSIQFISATPTQISLQGTGGITSSNVRFRVVDEGNNPVSGKNVKFSLSTSIGGVGLSNQSAVSNSSGDVVAVVQAGTQTTPVRVLATTTNAANIDISTQSAQLTITTGLPTQTAFSVGPNNFNIEGWDRDGENATITARLADHFGNAPPADTVVNFDSEGGKVQASCSTQSAGPTSEAGVCSVLFTSQNLRPDNGRVSVLAFAVGEEGFTDLNGDGFVDQASELVDANGRSTIDFGEAFVDFNENGIGDSNEPFKDFDTSGALSPASSLYKGILCKASSGLCDPSKTLHIRQTVPVILSGSNAYISSSHSRSSDIVLTSGSVTVDFKISDLHGNALPVGTTVTFAVENTKLVGSSGVFPVPNTPVCMNKSDQALLTNLLTSAIAIEGYCPLSAHSPGTFEYSATIAVPDTTPTIRTGKLTLKVKTPKGSEFAVSFTTVVL